MPITETTRIEQLIRRLTNDLLATIGLAFEAEVRRNALLAATYIDELTHFEMAVVDEVQQFIHDERLDTTWPTCPLHGRHPLWIRMAAGGLGWHCDQDHREIAKLGELGSGE
jgi:hypothetical protein